MPRPSEGQRGSVLIELAVVVSLYIMLLAGAIDLANTRFELALANSAAAAGARAVALTPPFTGDLGDAAERTAYAEARFDNALAAARYVLEQNGLDPDEFHVAASVVPVQGGPTDHRAVQVNVSRMANTERFFFSSMLARRICASASRSVLGIVLADDVVRVPEDGTVDAECPRP